MEDELNSTIDVSVDSTTDNVESVLSEVTFKTKVKKSNSGDAVFNGHCRYCSKRITVILKDDKGNCPKCDKPL